MFNIFNSESLWIGTDMEMFNKIRTRLEQEGIYIELNRTATSRNYKAKFIESLNLED